MTPGYKPRNMHEAFAHVIEELGEATQAAGKMQRFGYFGKWKGETNAERFMSEMNDVIRAYEEFKAWWGDYQKYNLTIGKK